ncbi:MAG: hypothetical protein ABJN42_14200 [Roseibium sp.]
MPKDLVSKLEVDGLTSKVGKVTAICDFADGSPSTLFFRESNDPNYYAWFPMTAEMHATVISKLNDQDHLAGIYVDAQNKLNRLIFYS